MGSDRIHDGAPSGDIAAKRSEGLGKRSLDNVEACHHAVPLGDASAARSVHADGMHLVEVSHRIIALRKVANRSEWSDIAVH